MHRSPEAERATLVNETVAATVEILRKTGRPIRRALVMRLVQIAFGAERLPSGALRRALDRELQCAA